MTDVHSVITDNIDVWTSAIKKRNSQGRGSSKKIELTGVSKLRELILELAIRGSLVPQDSNDEPASVLLKKISVERTKLIKDKKIKNSKPLPEISEDEMPSALPNGWLWTRLGTVAEIGPRNNLDDEIQTSFIPMPLITTSYKGVHGQEIRKWSEIKKGYTHFSDGDIALAKITPCFENSKAAVFSELKNGYGAGTTELHVARPIGEFLDRLFILLYLKAPQFLLVGQRKMTGSAGQKRVPKDFFECNPMPFPPLAEQHRIVAKVDELMVLCDQLEQQTEESITAHKALVEALLGALTNSASAMDLTAKDGGNSENAGAIFFQESWKRIAQHFDILFTTEDSIDQLKQTILQLAVMGKLVPQDPSDEPASVLLEKIAKEKERLIAEGNIKKQKALPEIGEDEKPFELPMGWVWSRLPEIGELARGKSKHRPRNDPALYMDGNIKLVQTGDVARSNGVIETHTALYNEIGLAQSRLWLKGTMCITIAANIADTGTLGFDACFPDSVVGFIPFDNRMMVKYFEYFVRTAKSNLEAYAPATAQKNINLEILGQLLVPLPPLAELNAIVKKIDKLMALCDQLKAQLSDAQTTQHHLADAIVEQAVG